MTVRNWQRQKGKGSCKRRGNWIEVILKEDGKEFFDPPLYEGKSAEIPEEYLDREIRKESMVMATTVKARLGAIVLTI